MMELASAEVRQLELPLTDAYAMSDGASPVLPTVLVTLHTTTGETGIGTADIIQTHPIPQTAPETITSLTTTLLPHLLEHGVRNPNHLHHRLTDHPGHENAKCALEMAYLDAYGKHHTQSIADLLGGPLHKTESLNGWVGLDTPDAMAADATAWADQGYESVKLKLAGHPDDDIDRVHAVADAAPDLWLRLDANEGYPDPQAAIHLAKAIEALPITHLEQPLPRDDPDGLQKVTRTTHVPVMADEPIITPQDADHYLTHGIADRLKYKILKHGGVIPTRHLLDLAHTRGLACVVGHGFCTSPAASTELHLTTTHPAVLRPVETVGTLKTAHEPFTPTPRIENATATPIDAPGHGVHVTSQEDLDQYTTHATTLP